jgi:RHS repeat-associated protein
MEENGKKSFFHNDHLGGTNVVTDEAGRQVKYLEYRPFGETKVEEGILNARKKFTGKELDEETGLYNFLARLYDPKIGRFVTADPIDFSDAGIKFAGGKDLQTFLANPQNLNRYSYCLNNPVRYTDPDGLFIAMSHGIDSKQGEEWAGKLKNELIRHGVKQDIYLFKWGPANKLNYRSQAGKSAQDYIAFINDLKKRYSSSEPVNVFVHSGGAVLLECALKKGLKVDNAVLVGSPLSESQSFISNTRETHIFQSNADVVNFWVTPWPQDTNNATYHNYRGVRHNDWVMPWNIKNTETKESILSEYSKVLNYRSDK